MKKSMVLLAILALVGFAFAGCYYKQDHDDSLTDPGGTGVQGYYLNVHCTPATVPANGSAFTVTVWLRDIGTKEPIPNQDVYLSLWTTDTTGVPGGIFPNDVASFDYEVTRINVRTGADGTATAVVHTRDGFRWADAEIRGLVQAELTLEWAGRDPIFLTEYGYFLIYNPYM